jgi:hypothetical protein
MASAPANEKISCQKMTNKTREFGGSFLRAVSGTLGFLTMFRIWDVYPE